MTLSEATTVVTIPKPLFSNYRSAEWTASAIPPGLFGFFQITWHLHSFKKKTSLGTAINRENNITFKLWPQSAGQWNLLQVFIYFSFYTTLVRALKHKGGADSSCLVLKGWGVPPSTHPRFLFSSSFFPLSFLLSNSRTFPHGRKSSRWNQWRFSLSANFAF